MKNGDYDWLIIEGNTIEEIQKKAQDETSKRGAVDAWSEKLEAE